MALQIGKKADIEKIPTKVLLAASKQRMSSGHDFWNDGWGGYGGNLVPADPVEFVFEHRIYKIKRQELLTILSTREHVPNKKERKAIRQQKAKHGN